MTTTKVTKREERGVTTQEDNIVGLSGMFGQGDVATPSCSLVQPMSQDKGAAGTYYLDGRNLDTLEVAVLHIAGTRTLWADIGAGIGAPVCKSNDRRLGYTTYEQFVVSGGDLIADDSDAESTQLSCASCRFEPTNEWGVEEDGLSCKFGYTLLLANVLDNDEPFLYYVKGAQMNSVMRRIVSPTLARKGRPWVTRYQFKPRLVEETGKKYWVSDITAIAEFDEDSQVLYASMAQAHGKQVAEPAATPPADGHGGIGN